MTRGIVSPPGSCRASLAAGAALGSQACASSSLPRPSSWRWQSLKHLPLTFRCRLASLLLVHGALPCPFLLWCLPGASVSPRTQLRVALCPSQEASSPWLLAALPCNPSSPCTFTQLFCCNGLKAFQSICKFPRAC